MEKPIQNKMKETEMNPIEQYFVWWVNELKENGFIQLIRREPFSIEYTPPKKSTMIVYEKKKVYRKNVPLLNRATYKFDYLIVWDISAKEFFYNLLDEQHPARTVCPFFAQIDEQGNHVSYIDVKPPSGGKMYSNNTTSYTFPIIQKVLWHFYEIWINKAIPIPMVSKGEIKSGNNQSLFTTTFVPKRYMLTDGGNAARKIHYRVNTLKEYLFRKQREINILNQAITQQTDLFNN